MATRIELANALADAFERKTRADGDEFYTLQDSAPEWMSEAIYAAHDSGEMLPNDWTYRFARSMAFDIVDGLQSGEDLADVVDVASDNLIPCYNGERLAWLASHLNRAALVDEAVEEYGFPQEGGILQAVAYGIQRELHLIGSALVAAIEEQADEDDA